MEPAATLPDLEPLYDTLRQRLWSQELQSYESWKPDAARRMDEWVGEARAAVKAAGGDPYNIPPVPVARRMAAERARLTSLRADLATIYAARRKSISLGRVAAPAYLATRRRTLKRILEARANLRVLGKEWIADRQARLADPRAIRTPLDNIYCCIEGEFMRDGGSPAEFAAAAREYRRAA